MGTILRWGIFAAWLLQQLPLLSDNGTRCVYFLTSDAKHDELSISVPKNYSSHSHLDQRDVRDDAMVTYTLPSEAFKFVEGRKDSYSWYDMKRTIYEDADIKILKMWYDDIYLDSFIKLII